MYSTRFISNNFNAVINSSIGKTLQQGLYIPCTECAKIVAVAAAIFMFYGNTKFAKKCVVSATVLTFLCYKFCCGHSTNSWFVFEKDRELELIKMTVKSSYLHYVKIGIITALFVYRSNQRPNPEFAGVMRAASRGNLSPLG
jgi:hypothetical protein